MSYLQLPFFAEASFTEQITLEDVPYIFQFNWNDRGLFWSMSIYTRENIAIIEGVKLVSSAELFSEHPDIGLPPGFLFVVDMRVSAADPLFNDFTNGNCFLIYQESV